MNNKENPTAGAGVSSQGIPPVLAAGTSRSFLNITALQLGAELSDYVVMRESEGLRRAGATPAERERWRERKRDKTQRRHVTPQGFEVWR